MLKNDKKSAIQECLMFVGGPLMGWCCLWLGFIVQDSVTSRRFELPAPYAALCLLLFGLGAAGFLLPLLCAQKVRHLKMVCRIGFFWIGLFFLGVVATLFRINVIGFLVMSIAPRVSVLWFYTTGLVWAVVVLVGLKRPRA